MYDRKFPATEVPVSHMNNIVYAFINYDVNGNVMTHDENADI